MDLQLTSTLDLYMSVKLIFSAFFFLLLCLRVFQNIEINYKGKMSKSFFKILNFAGIIMLIQEITYVLLLFAAENNKIALYCVYSLTFLALYFYCIYDMHEKNINNQK